jgi:hypothetical protein
MSDSLRLPPSAYPTTSEDPVRGEMSNVFTTPTQFNEIQSNTVADNQNTEVRTWNNELGPQGLASPQGFQYNSTYMLATL